MSDSATPLITTHQASLSIISTQSLLKLMPIESVMPSSHLILCRPLLLLHPIPPSIRVFSNESTLRMRWPKYWSFSFSISPSNEHSRPISFRMDWLDFLAYIYTNTCAQIFIVALLILTKTGKQLKCPPAHECISKLCLYIWQTTSQ